jgi:dihydrofolate reductase
VVNPVNGRIMVAACVVNWAGHINSDRVPKSGRTTVPWLIHGVGRPQGEAPTMISVFVGTSVDGFIARSNGALDFLPEGGGEPHGYDEFIASVDAIVIGRKTFETVLSFPAWPYGDKRVVVLSSRPLDLSAVVGGVVEQMGGSPAEIVSQLAARGVHHLYVDGGITIQGFLRAGLIQRLVITRVPVLIGDGIPLFGTLPRDVRLRHLMTRHYPSGLVQSEYTIAV